MKEQPKRPIPESYWVEPGRLLAGEYPGRFDEEQTRRRLDALIEADLDVFIDLTRPNEIPPYERTLHDEARMYNVEVRYHRFPIGDFGLPTPRQMKSILDTIDENLQAERKIYLHCWAGIGRTGTAIGCYLIRHGRLPQEAINQLGEWWKTVPKSHYHLHSPETQEQVDFIRNWAKYERNL
jgi:predicted protein tyrosine phosphatase